MARGKKYGTLLCGILSPVRGADEVRTIMQEFQFTANTPEGEWRTTIAGGATLVGVLLLMFLIFDVLLPGLLTNRIVLWAVIVVPALVAFSVVVRRTQHQSLGDYTLRLEGRHLTIVCPDQTVIDLGEVQHLQVDRHDSDNKCADIAIAGSKDQVKLRLRNAASWKGSSKAGDFRVMNKAAAAIEEALIV